MSKKTNMTVVNDISNRLVDELGFDFVDSEFKKEGSSYFLRVYIDKIGGITIDDCQKMSELLSEELDAKDLIKIPYYLEVSSPGLDRPLKTDKDYKRNIGKEIEIKLYSPIDNKKAFEGVLLGYTEEEIEIELSSKEKLSIPKEKISLVKLVIRF